MNSTTTSAPVLPSDMLRVSVEADGAIATTRVQVPTPGPGEVLIATEIVGICGSDTHAIAGHHPFLYPPYLPGHEAVGTVAAVGEAATQDATTDLMGKRVVLRPNVHCGRCPNCLRGKTNACDDLAWIGCDVSGRWPGAMADYVVAPAHNVHIIPDGMDWQDAALVECLATPVNAVRRAALMWGPQAGSSPSLAAARVLVIGAGTIGALVAQVARVDGASEVVACDLDASKRERALALGCSRAVIPAEITQEMVGRGFDVIFDCVATSSTMATATSAVSKAGTIVVVGVPPSTGEVDLPAVQDRELSILGCAGYTAGDVDRAIELVASGAVRVRQLISWIADVRDVGAAFDAASADSSGKVLIRLAEGDGAKG